MTLEQFCYWLQGYCELHNKAPSDDQWLLIRRNLMGVLTQKRIEEIKELMRDKT